LPAGKGEKVPWRRVSGDVRSVSPCGLKRLCWVRVFPARVGPSPASQQMPQAGAFAAVRSAAVSPCLEAWHHETTQFLLFEDAMGLLRAAIEVAGSQQEWAKNNGVDRATLNATLNGRRNLQPKVLQALGLEQVTVYRRLEEGSPSSGQFDEVGNSS
jgi:hypothetical protein